MNASNFLKYCTGVALVCGTLLFGSAALIYSANPATADAAPSTINEAGRYQMEMQAVWDGNDTYYYFLVWDTSTGRSKLYYGSSRMKKTTSASSSFNLPSSPL